MVEPKVDAAKSLERLLAEAKERVAKMSPEERRAMIEAQAQSFARGMTAKCKHGKLDFEQCPKCRGWE